MPTETPTGPKRPSRSYLRFSGFAFQLLGGLGISGWLGYRLDQYLELKFPVFTLLFLVIVLAGMLYQVNRSFNKE